MNAKRVASWSLALFLLVSVGVLVAKETRRASELEADVAAAPVEAPAAAATVVRYLHTTVRCTTCRKLEAYTTEAVTAGFAEDIAEGALVWESLNVEEPAHAHFVRDYALHTKAVVVAEVRDGREVRWKNLDRIWDLVGDKDAFVRYVQAEVRAFRDAT